MEIPYNKLIVKQIKEMAEIFTGFETRNKYEIQTEGGGSFSYAFEDSSFAARYFGGRNRPTKINVMDDKRSICVSVERPFYFFVPKMKIYNEKGEVIADVKGRLAFLKKVLEIRMSNSSKTFICESKAAHPWTFNFMENNREFARITKKWSGGKELISDADNFIVDFMGTDDETLKLVVLAMAFAIDVTYFEQ